MIPEYSRRRGPTYLRESPNDCVVFGIKLHSTIDRAVRKLNKGRIVRVVDGHDGETVACNLASHRAVQQPRVTPAGGKQDKRDVRGARGAC